MKKLIVLILILVTSPVFAFGSPKQENPKDPRGEVIGEFYYKPSGSYFCMGEGCVNDYYQYRWYKLRANYKIETFSADGCVINRIETDNGIYSVKPENIFYYSQYDPYQKFRDEIEARHKEPVKDKKK